VSLRGMQAVGCCFKKAGIRLLDARGGLTPRRRSADTGGSETTVRRMPDRLLGCGNTSLSVLVVHSALIERSGLMYLIRTTLCRVPTVREPGAVAFFIAVVRLPGRWRHFPSTRRPSEELSMSSARRRCLVSSCLALRTHQLHTRR
jgi:hypothetical protein